MSYKPGTKKTIKVSEKLSPETDSLGLVSLEPRILLDAAGFVTGADVAVETMAADNADMAVQTIFENGDDPTAAPIDGPWLGELSLNDSGESSDSDPTAAPIDGPWLDEITDDNSGEPDPTAAPIDGPWLDEFTGESDGGSGSDPTAAPIDGPWL